MRKARCLPCPIPAIMPPILSNPIEHIVAQELPCWWIIIWVDRIDVYIRNIKLAVQWCKQSAGCLSLALGKSDATEATCWTKLYSAHWSCPIWIIQQLVLQLRLVHYVMLGHCSVSYRHEQNRCSLLSNSTHLMFFRHPIYVIMAEKAKYYLTLSPS